MTIDIAHGGAGLAPVMVGIRSKKSKTTTIKVKKIKGQSKITSYKTPHKIISVSTGMHAREVMVKNQNKFDEFLNLDPWNYEEACVNTGIRYHMGNYFGDRRVSKTKGLREIWDSGALQMARDKVDFIDPVEVATAMNNAKIEGGVTIDILPASFDDNTLNMASIFGKIHRLNSWIMRNHSGNTKILNVIHGFNLDWRKMCFAQAIVDPTDSCWCSSDINRLPYHNGRAAMLTSDILNIKKATKTKTWVHILGIATNTFLAALIPLKNYVDKITTDAITAIKTSMSGALLYPDCKGMNIAAYDGMGDIFPQDMAIMRCNCSVCRTVNSNWVLANNGNLRNWHNVAVINSVLENLKALFDHLGIDGYLEYLKGANYDSGVLDVIPRILNALERGHMKASDFPQNSLILPNSFSLCRSKRFYLNKQIVERYIDYYNALRK